MPFVLYGCETWSVTLMEGHRLCVWEQGADGYIWAQERGSNRRMQKITWSKPSYFVHKILGDKIEDNEMGGACGT